MGAICNKDKKGKKEIKVASSPSIQSSGTASATMTGKFIFYKNTVDLNKKLLTQVEEESEVFNKIFKNDKNFDRWRDIIGKREERIVVRKTSKKNSIVPNFQTLINQVYFFKDDNINHIAHSFKRRYKADKDYYNKLLFRSPPNQLRFLSWLGIALNHVEFISDKEYAALVKEVLPEAILTQILKDLDRTAPDIPFFQRKEGQESLLQVLKALAVFDKEVGYCQGMNILVANMLLISDGDELSTFNLIRYIFSMKGLRFREFFVSGFPRLNMYLYVIKEIIKDQKKLLYDKMTDLVVPDEIWLFKWMQSLFALILPLEVIVRIWDCIFAFGIEFSINIIIALIEICEKDIDKVTDLGEFLDVFTIRITEDAEMISFREKLITTAKSIVIKETTFYNLKLTYDKLKNSGKLDNAYDGNSSSTDIESGNKAFFDHNKELIMFREKINILHGHIEVVDQNVEPHIGDSVINEEDIHIIDDSKHMEKFNEVEKKSINLIQSTKKVVLENYFNK